jgi:2-oxo-4-hydroxy-4-carboxy--5-ureidoimidazoline (OHCU) decarboxylase
MSDCLHCDIMELVDKQLADPDADLAEVAAKVAEAMTDVVLTAPPEDQAKLLAEVVALIGSIYLEKTGADGGASNRRH